MMHRVFHEACDISPTIFDLFAKKYIRVHKKYIALPNTINVSGDRGLVVIKYLWITGDAPHKNEINKDVPRTEGSIYNTFLFLLRCCANIHNIKYYSL